MTVTAAGWAVTLASIGGLLALDWLVLGRRPRALGFADAAWWSVFYTGVAVLFGVGLATVAGAAAATQYFAGYLVEKSLSVDNLFVFVIIIGAFAVPPAQQPKVLSLGITLALALRAVFIALGAALIHLFTFTFLIFGIGLMLTAVQLYRHRDADPDVGANPLIRAARRRLPVSEEYDGNRLLTRRDGRRMVTPLFLSLVAIGTTDVLFAFDSIPAVFGITDSGYIVFAANAYSLLGMRPLFFLVAGLLDRLVYMSVGLAVILAFIGAKLVLEFAHSVNHSVPVVPTAVSLAVVVAVLVAVVLASALRARRDPHARARAGSVLGRTDAGGGAGAPPETAPRAIREPPRG